MLFIVDEFIMKSGPGKSFRTGISLTELTKMFPNEEAAVEWFEAIQWPDGRYCLHCGGVDTTPVRNSRPMPYRCPDCRSYFSVRTGTALQNSRLSMHKWAFAIYLYVTHLKGVSSMRLHRDLNVTQKTAWFMLHRLREAWTDSGLEEFMGPVEADETYVGGREKNKHKNRKLNAGRGPVGKTPIIGVRDRDTGKIKAQVIGDTRASTLQGFVTKNTDENATVYTDDAAAYVGIKRKHESVKHSTGEYVRDMAHTNGIESFWATLKRAHKGTFHHFSKKHLHRYVTEFEGRHNVRPKDTADQMRNVVTGLVGKHLMYQNLVS